MRKIPLTKNRKLILERMKQANLHWGYGLYGGKEFFFSDGGSANASIVNGMLDVGLLAYEETVEGFSSQNIKVKEGTDK